jgi:hypothetical protein
MICLYEYMYMQHMCTLKPANDILAPYDGKVAYKDDDKYGIEDIDYSSMGKCTPTMENNVMSLAHYVTSFFVYVLD